jgi:hypothetical protein
MADLMNIGGIVIDGHPNRSAPLPVPTLNDLDLGSGTPIVTSEPSLGNPPVDGYILSSDMDGNRIWIPPIVGGSANTPYEQVMDFAVGYNTFITTLTTKPATITLFDSAGNLMQNMDVQVAFVGGVYTIIVYSSEIVLGVHLIITY